MEIGNRSRQNGICGWRLTNDTIVNRWLSGLYNNADPGCRICLGVEVNEKDLLFEYRQAGTQIDGQGSFSYSSFLIGYGDDLSQWCKINRYLLLPSMGLF